MTRKIFLLLSAFVLSSPALAELPEGLIYDDAYAWFDVTEDRIARNGEAVDLGWKLQYQLRIYGEMPERSAFKLVLSKDGEQLGELRETAQQKYYNTQPGFDWERPIRGMFQTSLVNWKTPIVGDGLFDLDVYYVDGATFEEHLARSYKLDVRSVGRMWGNASNAKPDAPHYYVNRHGDAGWSFIHQRPWKFPSYVQSSRGIDGNAVIAYWHTSPRDGKYRGQTVDMQTWIGGRLRARVNGERIDLGSSTLQQRVVNNDVRHIYAVHQDRNAEAYKTGPAYEDAIKFVTYETILPLTWRDDQERLKTRQNPTSVIYEATPRPNLVALNDHPGTWEVDWIVNGELIRQWTFEVDENGLIQPWDEAPDHITLHPFAHIVEMTIPEGGSSADGRLTDEFVEDGAFFGLGLPDEFADKVPTKGDAFPQPSAPPSNKSSEESSAAAVSSAAAATQQSDAADEPEGEASAPAEAISEQQQAEAVVTAPVAETGAAASESTGGGFVAGLVRLLLGVALLLGGLLLAQGSLGGLAESLAGLLKPLEANAAAVGYGLIALGIVSFALDLVALRPIIGNGAPQAAAIAGGAVLANLGFAQSLSGARSMIGFAAIALGVLHLFVGSAAVL